LSRHPFRRGFVRRLLLPAMTLLAFTACTFGAPSGATEQGQKISGLYQLMFWIAIGVGAITMGLILYSVLRFRRRTDELPKQTRFHVPLEITYTVIPIVIVGFIFAATYSVERKVDHVSPDPGLRVVAQAFQWQWRFSYPDYGISVIGSPTSMPTFEVPVGETVRIDLQAQDVIHAFYVPEFLFKRDAIPGQPNVFDFRVTEEGTFYGECAEFCGLNHAEMGFFVKAVTQAEFDQWVQEQQAKASPTPTPSASAGSSPSATPSQPTGVSPTPIDSAAG
jgi:cytochrome c oxidase subunit 2